jgi:hypothetical protein
MFYPESLVPLLHCHHREVSTVRLDSARKPSCK